MVSLRNVEARPNTIVSSTLINNLRPTTHKSSTSWCDTQIWIQRWFVCINNSSMVKGSNHLFCSTWKFFDGIVTPAIAQVYAWFRRFHGNLLNRTWHLKIGIFPHQLPVTSIQFIVNERLQSKTNINSNYTAAGQFRIMVDIPHMPFVYSLDWSSLLWHNICMVCTQMGLGRQ